MQIEKKKISDIVVHKGMTYAKGVILTRAIPGIDGLKPVQRRALYEMEVHGLKNGKRAKSIAVTGDTMKIHPNGDSSIYDTVCIMAQNSQSYNYPYVNGKGNFGKGYSKNTKASKPRYTEAGLSALGHELMKGLNSGAVKFVPNFDRTLEEPEVLPVTFPNILVNNVAGVAVGKSCSLPGFPIENVCKATSMISTGEIKTPEELAEVLQYPEFPTGGTVHVSRDKMVGLCKSGKGSFHISSRAEIYTDRITITEIPYTTKVENICEEVALAVKEKKITDVNDCINSISKDGLEINIMLKRGANPRAVYEQLCRFTSVRDSISYNVRVIYKNECKDDIGLLSLLQLWIDFRDECICNEIRTKKNEAEKEVHNREMWEKIQGHLGEIVAMMTKCKRAEAIENVKRDYGLDDAQADYLVNRKVYMITTDESEKELAELKVQRGVTKELEYKLSNRESRMERMREELDDIAKKYAIPRKTRVASLVPDGVTVMKKINEDSVGIRYTKSGLIKRLITTNDIVKFEEPEGDELLYSWGAKNNEYLLVFTRMGEVRKVLVDDIDASKGKMVEKLYLTLGLTSPDDIVYIDVAGDYKNHFNILFESGRGMRVDYSRAEGKRMKYIGLFDAVEPGKYWITKEDKFFLVTRNMKAAYGDLSLMGVFHNRQVFKLSRIDKNDKIIGIVELKDVPNPDSINLDKYHKGYTVKLGTDKLWDEEVLRKYREEKELKQQRLSEARKAREEEERKEREAKEFASLLRSMSSEN